MGGQPSAILAAFAERLGHDQETEFATALGEIEHIVMLRLQDRMR
jgi:2-oxo-4-hydroxy-4-carboxy--5-ureidoimidazoline (OHCU) decarboxylase